MIFQLSNVQLETAVKQLLINLNVDCFIHPQICSIYIADKDYENIINLVDGDLSIDEMENMYNENINNHFKNLNDNELATLILYLVNE